MSTQRVPLEALQKIRQYIKNALVLSDSENYPKIWFADSEEPPEPDSIAALGDLFYLGGIPEAALHRRNTRGQWFVSVANPGSVLTKLPGLKLKPEMRLVGYLYRLDQDGVGKIWALPEALGTTAHLEEALEGSGSDAPPQPKGAIADFMSAIVGDRSPMSYVVASILRRELLEFGALGKTSNWLNHQLVNRLPEQAQWQWRTTSIKDLSPKVRVYPDGKVALEFFTCRKTAPIALFQHLDQYTNGTYQAQSLDRAVATASRLSVQPG